MNFKVLWTNYKIYGIIIGIVLGTLVYNMLSIDFSFSCNPNIKIVDFVDSLFYILMNFIRFYAFILIISFFRIKEKVYAVLLGIESFKLSGNIVILIKLHNILYISSAIEPVFKIAVLLFFMKKEKVIFHKFLALFIVLAGAFVENILINFL